MTTATQVADRIAYRVHDKDEAELTAADYLTFLNDAVEDLSAAGWALPLSEATITMVAADYEYDVPATFAYIWQLRKEDADTAGLYDEIIPFWKWTCAYDSNGNPVVRLDSRWFTPVADKKILVMGQQRVTAYAGAGTVEPGAIGFLRERGVAYAAAYLAGGVSEYAQQRRELAEIAFRNSEVMLQNMPEEFRIIPGSRPVPGR